jgi:hypothetical protein
MSPQYARFRKLATAVIVVAALVVGFSSLTALVTPGIAVADDTTGTQPTTAVEVPTVDAPPSGVGPATAPVQVDTPAGTASAAGVTIPAAPASSTAGEYPTTPTGSIGTLTAPAAAPSTAQWITNPKWNGKPTAGRTTPAMPIFARDVDLTADVTTATLTVAGLGVYTPLVNGLPVSAAVLQPGYSDYEQSVEYRSYDVSTLLAHGTNRLSMQLGTGMYDSLSTPGRYSKLTRIGGALGFTARLDLTLTDGTAASYDTSSGWLTRLGGTTVADWYGGEDYDARTVGTDWTRAGTPLSQNDGWQAAQVATIPSGVTLFGQNAPAVEAISTVPAKSVTALGNGVWAVDFGTYVTGFPQLNITAAAGQVIRLYPAERVDGNGLPNQDTATGGSTAPIYDEYTFAGTGVPETWHPQFVYHGFQYLKVTGLGSAPLTAAQFSAVTVHADLARTGDLQTSDDRLNRLYQMTNNSIDANLQSVLTDCPNREKLGWLEQDYLLFDMLAARYDLSSYGKALVRTVAEAQRADGSMPEIAPESVAFPAPFSNDVNWGSALIMIPWKLYTTYGDAATLKAQYPAMRRYVDSLAKVATGNLLAFGLGDWITPAGTPITLVTSLGYYQAVSTVAQIATVVGDPARAQTYTALADTIKNAVNAAFYRDGSYGDDQAGNAMALVLGVAPDVAAVRSALLDAMAAAGNQFKVGEIGLSYLFTALSAMGRNDLLWDAIRKTSQPGFGYFLDGQFSALPEYWNGYAGSGSLAHIMLGYPAQWAIQDLAGIDQQAGGVGYRQLVITPAVYTGPDRVTASRALGYGTVTVSWQRTGQSATVSVTVPDGGSALVVLPDGNHQVGAGSFTFSTGLGSRPDYAPSTTDTTPTPSTPTVQVLSAAVSLVKVPWSAAIWANENGTSTQLSYDQWAQLNFAAPAIGVPAGSVTGFAIIGPGLTLRTPDAQQHSLTLAEWTALGYPAPVRLDRTAGKYQWSPAIWIVVKWTTAASTWEIRHLTYDEWTQLGYPQPGDAFLVPGSQIFQYTGTTAVYLSDPDGKIHWITADDYGHLGWPAVEVRNQAWVTVPGSNKLIFLTDRRAGKGYWATGEQWAAAGYPPAQSIRIPGLQWRTQGGGYAIVLNGGTAIPMDAAEYQSGGRPQLAP